MDYAIQFLWDSEAAVWGATSDEIPGLVLESGSFDALIERVRFAVPELMELNGVRADGGIREKSAGAFTQKWLHVFAQRQR